jgi:hypothetical protein
MIKIPYSHIKVALESGDVALNSIPLEIWEYDAGIRRDPDYAIDGRLTMFFDGRWSIFAYYGLSSAERICLLKHVAKYHMKKERMIVTYVSEFMSRKQWGQAVEEKVEEMLCEQFGFDIKYQLKDFPTRQIGETISDWLEEQNIRVKVTP